MRLQPLAVSEAPMIITNLNGISLEMAVWLVQDDYDYISKPNYVSATGVMKPLRQILLGSRLSADEKLAVDVADLIPSALGNSLHAAVERAWSPENYVKNLKKLGIPNSVIDRVLVNPEEKDLETLRLHGKDPIPVYIEQRAFRELDGFTIGGKFDGVFEGRVTDVKSTTVYTWIKGGRDDDYRLQLSIYRWLNPTKITDDVGRINFIFTDWAKRDAAMRPEYPSSRVMSKDIALLSLEETEAWLRAKLSQVAKHRNTPEPLLPECTEEELWMTDPKYRYYADPAKTSGKSSKNFTDLNEAKAYIQEKGKGVLLTVPGTPKRCGYCAAFPICTQKDKYNHE